MTESDFDQQTRDFFLGQLAALAPNPGEPRAEVTADDPEADAEWLAELTPEDLEVIQAGGAAAEELRRGYQDWRAGREDWPAAAEAIPLPAETSPSVLAYEAGRVDWADLSRDDRDAAIERRLGDAPSVAIAEFELGIRQTDQITQAEYTVALRREFERRRARAVAERGRP